MKHCTHPDHCEECWRHKMTAVRNNELRKEIVELLGLSHLKGTPLLEAAVKRLDQLLLIEEIAVAVEREGLFTASASATN
jgi:hypothetical protein